MTAVLHGLRSRWFLTGIGIVLVAVLIWILGPFWDPLAPDLLRLCLVGAIVVLWLVLNLWADHRRRRRDAALIEGVSGADLGPENTTAENASAEVADLRSKLARAMTLLKSARKTRGFLYEQPWYMIIGPPGAGKTTALLNAGLRFPLAEELGGYEVGGVGPTRLCEWYFTDEAVLIDTAGRYTTQDSDVTVDRTGWNEFLQLLRRTRPRQPLNGVLVAVAISDVAQGSVADRQGHARTIRRRLKELRDVFGMQLPVYMIFTKADLIAGFTEYFDDLNRESRAQVWGTTFPVRKEIAQPGAAFAAELTVMLDRISARMTERLQDERSLERRPAILGFPAQFASLTAPLAEFLNAAFGSSQLDPAPFLRGVYFASGTQEGAPIDRMVGALARGFGIDPNRARLLRSDHGRSYFLERLIKNVVLAEAMLASRNPAARRRQRLLRTGAWTAAGVGLAAGIVLMTIGWKANAEALARFDAARAAWRGRVDAAPLQPVAGADLRQIAPLLDEARALPFGLNSTDTTGPGFGFGQSHKLRTVATLVYQRALERMLLPRLIWRAEQEVRGLLQSRDTTRLYQVTRVYMMLGSLGPMDAAMVHAWAADDWGRELYPGAAQAPLRESLLRHLDTLVAQPIPAIALDGGLISEAQLAFSTISPAARVYALIRGAGIPAKPWIPANVDAADGGRWFSRTPPAKLTDPIPGLYTPAGFWSGLVPNLPAAVGRLGKESWVLGPSARVDLNDPRSLPALERQVIGLYTRDYIAVWTGLLRDLNIVVAPVPEQQMADLWLLSRPQSPIRGMLTAIVPNLSLAPPTAPAASTNPISQLANTLPNGIAALAQSGLVDTDATKVVDETFRPLRDFVARELDPVLQGLEELSRQLEQTSGGNSLPAGDAARRLLALVKDRPEPVRRWITALATGGQSVRGELERRTLLAAYNGDSMASGGGGPAPGRVCQAAERRFPFGDGPDLAMEDFVRLFEPNGAMDQFIAKQVRPFVIDQGGTWRPQPYMGIQPPFGAADIAAFQHIDQIRQAFFSYGSVARVSFLVQPLTADPKTKTATLELGGQPVASKTGETVPPKMFEWPGPGGMTSVRVTFDPAASTTTALSASGPWALFRLLAKGQRRGGDDHFQITFAQDDRRAMFDWQASANSAFAPGLLKGFRCPRLGN